MSIGSIGGIGSLDPAEMAKNFFKKADANNDGSIDKSELQTMLSQGPGAGKGAQDIDKIFAEVDTNGDGKISQTENENQMKKMGAQGGKPPSGPPPSGGGGGAAKSSNTQTYDTKDLNKDGTVSAQEEIQYDLTHPSAYDEQGNGSLNNSVSFKNLLDLTA